jgi:putative hemolysin
MSGIVTLEDLVEELVGDIATEHARHGQNAIEKQSDGSAIVSGTAPIREINRALGLELPEDGDWNTIAGLCLALAGGVPSSGDSFVVAGIRLDVVDASARRVRTVRVRPDA